MEKVSIARRRQQIRAVGAASFAEPAYHQIEPPQADPPQASPHVLDHQAAAVEVRPAEAVEPPLPEAQADAACPVSTIVFSGEESVALAHFIAALGQAPPGKRRIGFSVEMAVDPDDPGRLKMVFIPKPVATGRFISVKQASRVFGLSQDAIRRALTRGELRGIKIGRQWRVCLDSPRALEHHETAVGLQEE